MEYLLLTNDGTSTHEVTFVEEPDTDEIHDEIDDWVSDGDWGIDGASIDVAWTLYEVSGDDEEDREEIKSGNHTVEIDPDEESLIEAAGGDNNCDHDWTRDGEGGCLQNPGVWSTGGTSMLFASHCRRCGLHKTEQNTGSQRNPGEHDTITFSQPHSWCAECECETCRYPVNESYNLMTECDDEWPEGEEISSHSDFDSALEAAKEYAHENHVKKSGAVAIFLDDTDDGDGMYYVFLKD